MADYQAQYEQYKKDLIDNKRFMSVFNNLHHNVIRNYKDYIDRKGFISHISILSGISGFCLGIYSPDAPSLLLRIIPFALMCASGFLAYKEYNRFITDAGKSEFYSFYLKNHIQDQVLTDYQREMDLLINDIDDRIFNIKYYAGKIQAQSSPGSCNKDIEDLLHWINSLDNYKDRYSSIAFMPQYTKDLNNDYHFSTEIHKHIHE